MQVIVRFHDLDIDDRLRAVAQRKGDVLGRMAHDAERMEVDFAGARNPRISAHARCSARLDLRRATLRAHAEAAEPAAALERVTSKLRHQLDRLRAL